MPGITLVLLLAAVAAAASHLASAQADTSEKLTSLLLHLGVEAS